LSRTFYNRFFEALDPQKSFFLAEDLEIMRSTDGQLCEMMKKGDTRIPLAIHSIFKMRVAERIGFIEERMKKPFDVNTAATLETERKDSPWCKTKEELDALWEKRLINQVINYEIMNDALKQDGKGSSKLAKSPEERMRNFYQRLRNEIDQETTIDIVGLYLATFCHLFDPHTAYMTPEVVEDFEISMTNSISGIGATLSQEDQYIKITDLVKGGPAANDGRLQKGDCIIAVRQEKETEVVDLVDLSLRKAIKFIRGKKGTRVFLTVMHPGEPPRVIDLVRADVKLEDAAAQINFQTIPLPAPLGERKEIKIGVLNLPAFYYNCAKDVKTCLEKANAEDVDGLIVDLRLNGGGSLDDCVKVAGYFFGSGPVVQQRNKNKIDKLYDPNRGVVYSGPLVMLVDDFSASASEIVAACLQDCSRAIVVGSQQTHGKGTVQTVVPLEKAVAPRLFKDTPKLGALKLTIAKFYRINGGSTQLKGVIPDIRYPTFGGALSDYEADIPDALAWDEIPPLEFERKIDVRPWIPQLLKRSQERTAASEPFKAYQADIAKFTALRKTKTIELNKQKRLETAKMEKEWLKKSLVGANAAASIRRGDDNDDGKDDKANNADVLLDETLKILADLVILQNGGTLP
jgi:carboxyl-terminal processing protease